MIKQITHRRRLLVLATALTAIIVTALTVPTAQASDQNTANSANSPGFTVEPVGDPFEAAFTIESGTHPGADRIAAQKKILLKDGNGQLMSLECNFNDAAQIVLETGFEQICFKPTNLPGWLKMEIPGSFGIQASQDRPLTVIANDNGTTKTIDVEKNKTGDLANSKGQRTIVVEIKTPGAP